MEEWKNGQRVFPPSLLHDGDKKPDDWQSQDLTDVVFVSMWGAVRPDCLKNHQFASFIAICFERPEQIERQNMFVS